MSKKKRIEQLEAQVAAIQGWICGADPWLMELRAVLPQSAKVLRGKGWKHFKVGK